MNYVFVTNQAHRIKFPQIPASQHPQHTHTHTKGGKQINETFYFQFTKVVRGDFLFAHCSFRCKYYFVAHPLGLINVFPRSV